MHDEQPQSQKQQEQEQERAQIHELVGAVYRGFLGREPDPAGLQYWSGMLAAGADAGALVYAVMGSAEYARQAERKGAGSHAGARVARHAAQLLADAPLTVVDVGAQDLEDEQHVYAPLAAHALPCRVIGFEPLAQRLAERRRREGAQDEAGSHVTLYPDFIGDGHRQVFHINEPDATSSLLPFNHALNRELAGLSHLRTERTVEVETRELDAVLAAVPRIDFLKLDIQGFELPALQHAREVLARTCVVHCEVAFAPIYQGQALFSEVEAELRAHGFYFLDFSATCRYACHCASASGSRDRLGWADAVFFRQPALVDGPRALLAQMLVALLVYNKHSLAEALAERYDATTTAGTRFGPLFQEPAP